MCAALNATIGTAVLGLGALLPSQAAILTNASLLTTRLQQERMRRSVMPVVGFANTNALEVGCLGGTEAVAAPITGLASSPPRTFVSTRRVLAPTHCLSKARRGRRRPGSEDNDENDDDYGDGGGNDGSGGSGGDSGDWGDDEDQHGRNIFESMWLWQAMCLFSFLQAVHHMTTGSKSGEAAEVSALASLTHSFYNTSHSHATCRA